MQASSDKENECSETNGLIDYNYGPTFEPDVKQILSSLSSMDVENYRPTNFLTLSSIDVENNLLLRQALYRTLRVYPLRHSLKYFYGHLTWTG